MASTYADLESWKSHAHYSLHSLKEIQDQLNETKAAAQEEIEDKLQHVQKLEAQLSMLDLERADLRIKNNDAALEV